MVKRELEAAGALSVGILIAVIVLAFMLDRSALAATGSSFIGAVVGFFSSIPNTLASFIYGIGNDITVDVGKILSSITGVFTNGISGGASGAGSAISNFFKSIWHDITHL